MVSEFWLEAFLTSYSHFVLFFGQSSLLLTSDFAHLGGVNFLCLVIFRYTAKMISTKNRPHQDGQKFCKQPKPAQSIFSPTYRHNNPKNRQMSRIFWLLFCPNILSQKLVRWWKKLLENWVPLTQTRSILVKAVKTLFFLFLLEPLYKIGSHFK